MLKLRCICTRTSVRCSTPSHNCDALGPHYRFSCLPDRSPRVDVKVFGSARGPRDAEVLADRHDHQKAIEGLMVNPHTLRSPAASSTRVSFSACAGAGLLSLFVKGTHAFFGFGKKTQ